MVMYRIHEERLRVLAFATSMILISMVHPLRSFFVL